MIRRKILIPTLALAAALVVASGSAQGSTASRKATTLNGAGSSFVFPLVSTWAPLFKSVSGITLNYNAIGSGAGIKAISDRSVDFGASDAPLTADQLTNCNGCMTIPFAFSGTAVAYRGSGLPWGLKITGPIIADIYLGKITNWSDAAIQKLNPKVTLPDKAITPIFRSDASGTSYNFTEYLSAISPEWKQAIGTGTQPAFPAGAGAAKSSGVSALLAKTDGGIAYVDVAYALEHNFAMFAVKNRAGRFVLPGLKQIAAAASLVTKATATDTGLVLSVVNPPKPSLPKFKPIKTKSKKLRAKLLKQRKKKLAEARAKNKKLEIAYPICTHVYAVVPRASTQATALKTFFNWALTKGQAAAIGNPLRFVTLPKAVQKTSLNLVKQIQQSS